MEPDYDAAAVVLDVLIRTQQVVPPKTLLSISKKFPTQAVILSKNLSNEDSKMVYEQWFTFRGGLRAEVELSRMATLLEGEHPSEDMVEKTVNESEEEVTVSIRVPGAADAIGIGLGRGCGDGVMGRSRIGWPETMTYDLAENERQSTAPVLLDWPGERITIQRHPVYQSFSSCYYLQPLNNATRHALIAHWLGMAERDMPWHIAAVKTLHWTGEPAYFSALGMELDQAREALNETGQLLAKRGLLRPDLAGVVHPRLLVAVSCDMNPCPLKNPGARTFR